ncbi:MAG: monovalent cation/H(+) antiporter subunit G [Rickettsiales bacterium]|nr:monovalent cation/H(+) antiporter subunit G [Rickettsiales bacterium]
MEYLGIALIIIGGIFCAVGAFGFYRMPDLYTKMHASGISDSCGCMISIVGIICLTGFDKIALKLLFLLCVLLVMNATSTNILTRAAAVTNNKPILGKLKKKVEND